MVRKHIFLFGRVQGVGLRFRTYHIANLFGLTGWVKNLSDGTVEMEVQGKETEIEQMLWQIEQGNFIVIDKIEQEKIPVIKEHGFSIQE